MFLYEVDPLFFYDSNKDGYGDFAGFIKKMDYFDFLNVDGIVFPDIFNQEDIILKNIQLTIFDKYGNINELKEIVQKLKNKNKEFFIEINLEKILSSAIVKTSFEDMKSIDIMKFIDEENNSQLNDLTWNIEKRINAFKKVISFWTNKINVNNYIITDFEFIYEKNNKLDSKLYEQLKFFYNEIKQINQNAIVGLKSLHLSNSTINRIFKNDIGIICDMFIDSSYSLIGTEKKHKFDIMKNFEHKVVLKKIKQIKIEPKLFTRYFVSFNNNRIGRVNSRWLNETILINESNKCLLMLSNSLPYSSINYYGDEIGMMRLDIENRDDFHDYEFIEKKRKMEFNKYKTIDFEQSQMFLSRINSQSTFTWNNNVNAGFSENKKIFRKLPLNWKTHNLLKQYNDNDSIVNFYKKIVEQLRNIEKLFGDEKQQKISIKLKRKIFIIKFGTKNNIQMILINFSNKSINKKINKKWKVVLSTFTNKNYDSKIEMFCPYESVVLTRK